MPPNRRRKGRKDVATNAWTSISVPVMSVLVGIWKGPQQVHLVVLWKAIYIHGLEVPLLVRLLLLLDPPPLLRLGHHHLCLLLLLPVTWGVHTIIHLCLGLISLRSEVLLWIHGHIDPMN